MPLVPPVPWWCRWCRRSRSWSCPWFRPWRRWSQWSRRSPSSSCRGAAGRRRRRRTAAPAVVQLAAFVKVCDRDRPSPGGPPSPRSRTPASSARRKRRSRRSAVRARHRPAGGAAAGRERRAAHRGPVPTGADVLVDAAPLDQEFGADAAVPVAGGGAVVGVDVRAPVGRVPVKLKLYCALVASFEARPLLISPTGRAGRGGRGGGRGRGGGNGGRCTSRPASAPLARSAQPRHRCRTAGWRPLSMRSSAQRWRSTVQQATWPLGSRTWAAPPDPTTNPCPSRCSDKSDRSSRAGTRAHAAVGEAASRRCDPVST